MTDPLTEALSVLERGREPVLATIIATEGSSPLPAGSLMLMGDDGRLLCGSVGGGGLEASVLEKTRELLLGGKASALATFELTERDATLGIICGGKAEILIERLRTDDRGTLEQLCSLRKEGVTPILIRHLDSSGGVKARTVGSPGDLTAAGNSYAGKIIADTRLKRKAFAEAVRLAEHREKVVHIPVPLGQLVLQPVPGIRGLTLFGAGHVGVHVCRIAAHVGFSVVVVDPRAEMLTSARFPDASRLLEKEYVKAFDDLEIRPSTSIVIVTPGHQSDEAVLERALQTDAGYLGMIGSAKKVAVCFANLRKRGVAAKELKRVHSPVGLDIGAVTAEEIAVSIVAELIRHRRRSTSPPVSLRDKRRKRGTHS